MATWCVYIHCIGVIIDVQHRSLIVPFGHGIPLHIFPFSGMCAVASSAFGWSVRKTILTFSTNSNGEQASSNKNTELKMINGNRSTEPKWHIRPEHSWCTRRECLTSGLALHRRKRWRCKSQQQPQQKRKTKKKKQTQIVSTRIARNLWQSAPEEDGNGKEYK